MSHWVRPPGPVSDGLRIGLFGGSFNPAHEGHLHVSETARKALKLDYVWWLVTPGNPLKRASELADLLTRMAGAAAIARSSRTRITDIEARLGTRYSVDTIAALQRRFPGVSFVWVMGSDNLASFARWRNWTKLARMVPIAVVRRPGSALATSQSPLIRRFGLARNLCEPPAILLLDGRRTPQSSTRLRAVLEPRLPAC